MNIFYPMGYDDNGLPTEKRVQNYFNVRCDASLPYDPSLASKLQALKKEEEARLAQLKAEEEEARLKKLAEFQAQAKAKAAEKGQAKVSFEETISSSEAASTSQPAPSKPTGVPSP